MLGDCFASLAMFTVWQDIARSNGLIGRSVAEMRNNDCDAAIPQLKVPSSSHMRGSGRRSWMGEATLARDAP